MEVDNCDVNSDGGHSMDEQDELSTPDDKLFFIEGPCTDSEKDDETIRAIRWAEPLDFTYRLHYVPVSLCYYRVNF